ncbi:MAG: ZIP family metal transporter [Gemmatimonadaceae bacterium]|nr:ZIP family metal transporter [Gemmatimonadaceae bacterium]
MITPLTLALAAAFANVLGAGAIVARRQWRAAVLDALLAFSAGFLIAVVLADLAPEAFARSGARAGVVMLAGFLLVHLSQHVFVQHFHFGEETHDVRASVSASALVGLLLHTFVDGVAIATAFAVSAPLGELVFGAIFLHKVPEGFAIASLYLASGHTRRQAFFAAATLGAATVLGVLATNASSLLATDGLALSAGVTLYVGASNLIPEFQAKGKWRNHIAFFGGALLAVASRTLITGG